MKKKNNREIKTYLRPNNGLYRHLALFNAVGEVVAGVVEGEEKKSTNES